MAKKQILAIVGSLREKSWNRQLAEAAQAYLAGKADVKILKYDDLPYMNEDIEFPTPEPVQRVRDEFNAADGIWIFTPEYNHAYPGVLKNLIDWLSRPQGEDKGQVWKGKPVAIAGTTPGGGGTLVAQDILVMTLSLLNAKIMNQPRLSISHVTEQAEGDQLTLTSSQEYLEKEADAFLKFLEK